MNLAFELHERQSVAFESPATEILYGGAAGGGKSHWLRVELLRWMVEVPGIQCFLFRRTYPELVASHLEGPTGFHAMLAPWVQARVCKINLTEMTIELPGSRSKLWLCHCQHEKDMYRFQGAEMHVLAIDELTHFPASIYAFLRGRVRLGGLVVPAHLRTLLPRILTASNPGGVGHNWVRAAFRDPAPPLEIWRTAAADGGMLRQFIPARLEDNPTLTTNDPAYADRLRGLGNDALVRAMLEGDWNIVAGGAIDDLWDESRHVVKPFKVPAGWRIDRSFDWGSSKPYSVGWWAESDGTEVTLADGTKRSYPKGTLFRIGELYGWNGKPNEGNRRIATEIAREILRTEEAMELRGRVMPGPADPSIYDVADGRSIADDMANVGVRWERADKGPGSRINGLERVRQFLRSSLQSPMEGPGLFIFDTCRHAIRTLPTLPRDTRKSDDVDTESEDHCYDETRYRVLAQKRQPAIVRLRRG